MDVPVLLRFPQTARLRPLFPLSRGIPQGDDRRVPNGIIFVLEAGLRLARRPPPGYGPYKTLSNRFVRWSRTGVFERIFAALAAEGGRAIAAHPRCHAHQGAPHGGEPAEQGGTSLAEVAPKAG